MKLQIGLLMIFIITIDAQRQQPPNSRPTKCEDLPISFCQQSNQSLRTAMFCKMLDGKCVARECHELIEMECRSTPSCQYNNDAKVCTKYQFFTTPCAQRQNCTGLLGNLCNRDESGKCESFCSRLATASFKDCLNVYCNFDQRANKCLEWGTVIKPPEPQQQPNLPVETGQQGNNSELILDLSQIAILQKHKTISILLWSWSSLLLLSGLFYSI